MAPETDALRPNSLQPRSEEPARTTLSTVVMVPSPGSLVQHSALETLLIPVTTTVQFEESMEPPARFLRKCPNCPGEELVVAIDKDIKKDLLSQSHHITRTVDEGRQREPTGAVFLRGVQNPASQAHSYTKRIE